MSVSSSMVAWAADAVTIKGMLWEGRLSGYKNFQVEMVKSSGGKFAAGFLPDNQLITFLSLTEFD